MINQATIPSDKHFRNAWALSGSVITEDLTVANTIILKEKLESVKTVTMMNKMLLFMKALERW